MHTQRSQFSHSQDAKLFANTHRSPQRRTNIHITTNAFGKLITSRRVRLRLEFHILFGICATFVGALCSMRCTVTATLGGRAFSTRSLSVGLDMDMSPPTRLCGG